MTGTEVMERRSSMDEAFDASQVPAERPAGPQQITIDNRPNGAQKVAVYRQKATVLREIKTLANAAGDGWFYRWPVKNKDGTTDWVEGPSVKCTNAVAREYGNCFVQVTAVDLGQHWMINARFLDLETGFALERPYQQRKGQNIGGKMDKDRALDIVFQIGVSKATRNVVANALAEFVDYGFDEAKAAIVGRVGKNLDGYKAKVAARLIELKVPADRVEAQVGKTIDKWLAPDVARVIAEIQSVVDGMADPDEMWPPKEFGTARPSENDERPARDVNADVQQQGQKAETAKTAEPTKAAEPAKEPAKPAAEPEPESDAVMNHVNRAIELAATADKSKLDELDDQVCAVTDRERREDARAKWNEAYLVRKNELRSGHTGPSALTPKSNSEEQLDDWIKEMKADLAKCKTVEDVDALQDKVAGELTGDQARHDDWINACNSKARDLSRRGKR